jgi:hypothetical protein
VRIFEFPGHYDIYFVTFSIVAQHRRTHSFLLLFESLVHVLMNLAKQGVFIREITANAYTKTGISMCRSLGMNYIRAHIDHGEIFNGKVQDMLKLNIFRRYPLLVKLYECANEAEANSTIS